MGLVIASILLSSAIITYALLIRERKTTLYQRVDNSVCKCHDCVHAKECNAFVGKTALGKTTLGSE